MSAVAWITFLPLLVFLRCYVVELWANMHETDEMIPDLGSRQTDGQTDDGHHALCLHAPCGGGGGEGVINCTRVGLSKKRMDCYLKNRGYEYIPN